MVNQVTDKAIMKGCAMSSQSIFKVFLVILFTGLVTVACESDNNSSTIVKKESHARFDLNAIKKIIQEKNNQFTKAHVTSDNEAIDTLFTLDAKSFPPNAEPVVGRSAIAALTAEYIEFGVSEFFEETVELYGCEDMLIDQGNFIMKYGKDNILEKGKYLNVWKKIDSQWKIYSNMWNTND